MSVTRERPKDRADLVVWRLVDGKRGHENQSRGLVQALASLYPLEEYVLPVSAAVTSLLDCLRGRFPPAEELPQPGLLVGAGRQTHLPLLAAKRRTGARAVVLMKPAAWLRPFFDFCLVPEHDRARGKNIFATRGALTSVVPGGAHHVGGGLFLIGGPSAHHGWVSAAMVGNVLALTRAFPERRWKLTTSRRTPAETTQGLLALREKNLEIWPVEKTGPDWVPHELGEAGVAWVTEDSVSMVYEALTSGAGVGVLPAPRLKETSRVARGLDLLVAQNLVSRFDPNRPAVDPVRPATPFHEAERCARHLVERFPGLFPP
jgi:uncharacterized protein